VYGLAERSGGVVKVVSLEGKGSAFTLFLPRSSERLEGEAGAQPDLPTRLLIVDDTPSSLESARLGLEGIVPALLTAGSGPDALALLEQHGDIGAVLSDVMMPGMSGIELAVSIAQHYPRLPVVFMTGYSDKLEEGADLGRPVMAKPFTTDEFLAALAEARRQLQRTSNVVRLDSARS
jgi:CheY-like chemotaxis protein